jgi:uncharacterized protein
MPHHFDFAGQTMQMVDEATLLWPSQRALLVADLHLEKGSAFAKVGQMLPPYDSIATLVRLGEIVERHDVSSIYCLGDNFHDDDGPGRLGGAEWELLEQISARYDWHWIIGNHDAALADKICGSVHVEMIVQGICLRHETQPGYMAPEISGHYHPKFRVSVKGRSVSRRAMLQIGNRLILPAFGSFAGGMDVAEIAAIVVPDGDAIARIHTQDRCVSMVVA